MSRFTAEELLKTGQKKIIGKAGVFFLLLLLAGGTVAVALVFPCMIRLYFSEDETENISLDLGRMVTVG